MEPIRKVGVVGGGQMGSGIAHVVALSGYDVAINDLSRDRYDAALEAITNNLATIRTPRAFMTTIRTKLLL